MEETIVEINDDLCSWDALEPPEGPALKTSIELCESPFVMCSSDGCMKIKLKKPWSHRPTYSISNHGKLCGELKSQRMAGGM